MTLAGIDYWSVLVVALVAFGVGGVLVSSAGEPQLVAHGFTTEHKRAYHGKGAAPWPLIIAFVAELIMA